MLSSKEREVLKKISVACGDKRSCLMYREELSKRGSFSSIKLKEVDGLISSLAQDGYIDAAVTVRCGEKAYCIILTEKGRSYKRERVNSRRYLYYRLLLAVISAIVTFLVGRLLYLIVS